MVPSKTFLELIFPHHAAKSDLEIIAAASEAEPGQARLKGAKTQETYSPKVYRLLSTNGGQLIGLVEAAELLEPPFVSTYWLIEENGNGHHD